MSTRRASCSLKPSPLMGEGWVGVACETGSVLRRTPPLPNPSPSRGGAFRRWVFGLALIPLALLAGCRKAEATDPFPLPDRPVSPIVSPRFSNEDERDRFKEAETVMKLGD